MIGFDQGFCWVHSLWPYWEITCNESFSAPPTSSQATTRRFVVNSESLPFYSVCPTPFVSPRDSSAPMLFPVSLPLPWGICLYLLPNYWPVSFLLHQSQLRVFTQCANIAHQSPVAWVPSAPLCGLFFLLWEGCFILGGRSPVPQTSLQLKRYLEGDLEFLILSDRPVK